MDFLQGLNPHQQDAVRHGCGPMLILAGAGSGKTRVITHRICHLMLRQRVPGEAILAVTFTNKAADEMRERVARLLGPVEGLRLPFLATFHSFCVRLLRRDGDALADLRPGFTRSFLIYDEDDQLAVVKAAFRQLGLDEKFMQYRAALSRISRAKNNGQTPEQMHQSARDPHTTRLAVVFDRYEARLRQANALDFDDLLLEAVRLLRLDDARRHACNQRFEYLLIDEYQDTNRSQYELMRLLSEERGNVCVVGDEDQSIYGWRGADIRNILEFEKDYPTAVVIRLEQNYRSTKNILEGAGAVVARNVQRKGKWLWTDADAGEPIGVFGAADAENEALFVADTIERILAAVPEERVAVLYRTNFQSRQIEEALRRHGRKYLVVGGFSFYQRAEVKDILSYLKLLVSPHDPVSLLRVVNTPARGIGRTTMEQVEDCSRQHACSLWTAIGKMLDEKLLSARVEAALASFRKLIEELAEAARDEPLGHLLKRIVERTGYRAMLESEATPQSESRLQNLDELVNAGAEAAQRGEGPAEFLDHAALVAETDALDPRAQVSLLTLHNAKGLEFPVVFITGLEEGLFPHARSLSSESLMEEERRLCYVGMTRAQKRLILTWARTRRKFGGGPQESCKPARFLAEIPREVVSALSVSIPELDLYGERWEARQTVKRSTYTGKTYNSLENVAQFFSERGLPVPALKTAAAAPSSAPARKPSAPPGKKKFRAGTTVQHPRYGKGLVLRREGEGEDAKLTVSFPGHGLKKLVERYAGLKIEE